MTPPPADPGGWPVFETPPAAAFIDVDGTLLAETTSFLFAGILKRRGMLRSSHLLRGMYFGLQHRFGRLDYGQLIQFGLKCIAGIPTVELERIAYENFAQNIKPRLYPGVVEHLDRLRRAGTPLVLVSSSPGLVIRPLAIYLSCSDMLTTPIVTRRGRLVGIGEGPPCYGEGKLHHARLWAEDQAISLGASAAYADNWSDRSLLQSVGHAVVVHPRGRLRRLARARNWSVVRPARLRPPAVP